MSNSFYPQIEELVNRVAGLERELAHVMEIVRRIGDESRSTRVHLRDLEKEQIRHVAVMDKTANSLLTFEQYARDKDAALVKAVEGMTELLENTRGALVALRVDRARDEARTTRQAFAVWLATATAVISIVFATFSGQLAEKLWG